MKQVPVLYMFDVVVDETYMFVHDLFRHQSVIIKYTWGQMGDPNSVRFQPNPMTKSEAKKVEIDLKHIGASFKITPTLL